MVFGQVVSGENIVKKIEGQKTDANNRPLENCTIVHCGELVLASKNKKKSNFCASNISICFSTCF